MPSGEMFSKICSELFDVGCCTTSKDDTICNRKEIEKLRANADVMVGRGPVLKIVAGDKKRVEWG